MQEPESQWYRRYVPIGVIYPRDGRYWYALPLPKGGRKAFPLKRKPSAPTTTLKTEAGDFAAKIYERYYRKQVSANIQPYLNEFEAYETSRCCQRHLINKLSDIRDFIEVQGIESIDQIQTPAVNLYLGHLAAKGKDPKTRKNVRGNLSRFCSWLCGVKQVIPFNPVRESERPVEQVEKPIMFLSRQELDAAIACAIEHKMYPVLWAIYTGLRRSELARIVPEDVRETPKGPILQVHQRKGGKPIVKSIPLHPKLVPIFAEMPKTARQPLFPLGTSDQWSAYLDEIRKVVPKLARKRGGWQDFRRSFGSLLLQAGVKIERISKLLRHTNIGTTSRYYAHLDAEAGREDLVKI